MKLEKQLVLNTNPTKNGRSYKLDTLTEIANKLNGLDESVRFITLGYPEGLAVSLKDVVGRIDSAQIENGALYVDVTLFEDLPACKDIKSILDKSVFRPGGSGNIVNEIVEDYELICISLVPADNDAITF